MIIRSIQKPNEIMKYFEINEKDDIYVAEQ